MAGTQGLRNKSGLGPAFVQQNAAATVQNRMFLEEATGIAHIQNGIYDAANDNYIELGEITISPAANGDISILPDGSGNIVGSTAGGNFNLTTTGGSFNLTTGGGGNLVFITSGAGTTDVTGRAEIFRGISSSAGSLTMVRNEIQEHKDTSDATPTTLLAINVSEGQMITFKALINGFLSTGADAVGAQVFAAVSRAPAGAAQLLGVPVINIETNTFVDVLLGINVEFLVVGNDAHFRVTGKAAQDWYWAIDVIEFITNLP